MSSRQCPLLMRHMSMGNNEAAEGFSSAQIRRGFSWKRRRVKDEWSGNDGWAESCRGTVSDRPVWWFIVKADVTQQNHNGSWSRHIFFTTVFSRCVFNSIKIHFLFSFQLFWPKWVGMRFVTYIFMVAFIFWRVAGLLCAGGDRLEVVVVHGRETPLDPAWAEPIHIISHQNIMSAPLSTVTKQVGYAL